MQDETGLTLDECAFAIRMADWYKRGLLTCYPGLIQELSMLLNTRCKIEPEHLITIFDVIVFLRSQGTSVLPSSQPSPKE